jgi:hypothetical protein
MLDLPLSVNHALASDRIGDSLLQQLAENRIRNWCETAIRAGPGFALTSSRDTLTLGTDAQSGKEDSLSDFSGGL